MRQNLLEELNAGCSALSWSTLDQKHFWGRNLDFNRLAAETKVTYVPRGTEYCFCGTSLENSENPQCKQLHSMLLWVPVCSQKAVPQFSMKESMKKD